MLEKITISPLILTELQCRAYSECVEKFGDVQEYVEMYSNYCTVTEGLVADLGSGDCQYIIGLAKLYPNLRFHCYELSDAMIALAETKINDAGLADRIRIIKGDALEIKGTYDLLLANRFIHRCYDVPKFWQVANEVSKNLFVTDHYRPETEEQLNEIVKMASDHLAEAREWNQLTFDESVIPVEYIFNQFKSALAASHTISEVQEQIASYGYNIYHRDTGHLIPEGDFLVK